MTHKDSDGFLCIPVQLLKIVVAMALVPCLTFHGFGVKARPFIYCLLLKSDQFQLTIFSVLNKKKKATVVPKEAPMLAMKALELRKKQDKVERTLLVVFHMTWT